MSDEFVTIPDIIRAHAAARPDADAIVQDGDRLSYAELDALMDRVAASLQRDGVAPQQSIAICASSSLNYAALFVGALRAGVAVAPIAPSSGGGASESSTWSPAVTAAAASPRDASAFTVCVPPPGSSISG